MVNETPIRRRHYAGHWLHYVEAVVTSKQNRVRARSRHASTTVFSTVGQPRFEKRFLRKQNPLRHYSKERMLLLH